MIGPQTPAPRDDWRAGEPEGALPPLAGYGAAAAGEAFFPTEWRGRPLTVAVRGNGAPGARLKRTTLWRRPEGARPGEEPADEAPAEEWEALSLEFSTCPPFPEIRLLQARAAGDPPGASKASQVLEPGALLVVDIRGAGPMLRVRAYVAGRKSKSTRPEPVPPKRPDDDAPSRGGQPGGPAGG